MEISLLKVIKNKDIITEAKKLFGLEYNGKGYWDPIKDETAFCIIYPGPDSSGTYQSGDGWLWSGTIKKPYDRDISSDPEVFLASCEKDEEEGKKQYIVYFDDLMYFLAKNKCLEEGEEYLVTAYYKDIAWEDVNK